MKPGLIYYAHDEGSRLRCDGSTVKWLAHFGYPDDKDEGPYDENIPPFHLDVRTLGMYEQACDACGETWPTVTACLATIFSPEHFAMCFEKGLASFYTKRRGR